MDMPKFYGVQYGGTLESAKGWAKRIGNFHIISGKVNFRRFSAHYHDIQCRGFPELYSALEEFASSANLTISQIHKTYDSEFNWEKHYEIYFVDRINNNNKKFFKNYKGEIISYARHPEKLNIEKPMLILGHRLENKFSKTIDINEALKPVHKTLIKNLDEIIQSQTI